MSKTNEARAYRVGGRYFVRSQHGWTAFGKRGEELSHFILGADAREFLNQLAKLDGSKIKPEKKALRAEELLAHARVAFNDTRIAETVAAAMGAIPEIGPIPINVAVSAEEKTA